MFVFQSVGVSIHGWCNSCGLATARLSQNYVLEDYWLGMPVCAGIVGLCIGRHTLVHIESHVCENFPLSTSKVTLTSSRCCMATLLADYPSNQIVPWGQGTYKDRLVEILLTGTSFMGYFVRRLAVVISCTQLYVVQIRGRKHPLRIICMPSPNLSHPSPSTTS